MKKFKYLVVREDGTRYRMTIDEKPASITLLQRLVDGFIYFESPLNHPALRGCYAVVNEEGAIRNLPKNKAYPFLRGTIVIAKREAFQS